MHHYVICQFYHHKINSHKLDAVAYGTPNGCVVYFHIYDMATAHSATDNSKQDIQAQEELGV